MRVGFRSAAGCPARKPVMPAPAGTRRPQRERLKPEAQSLQAACVRAACSVSYLGVSRNRISSLSVPRMKNVLGSIVFS